MPVDVEYDEDEDDVEYDEVEDEQLQQRDLVGDEVVFHREHQRDGESDTHWRQRVIRAILTHAKQVNTYHYIKTDTIEELMKDRFGTTLRVDRSTLQAEVVKISVELMREELGLN